MAPLENRVLPPRSASGAHSSTTTEAPASRAASAAARPARPAPTTTMSAATSLMRHLRLRTRKLADRMAEKQRYLCIWRIPNRLHRPVTCFCLQGIRERLWNHARGGDDG